MAYQWTTEYSSARRQFATQDFTEPFDRGRTFDVVFCFEVAEHLPAIAAEVLIKSICCHTSLAFFSAGCPWQPGENHVNCQWPSYWQHLFNQHGFACSDDIRQSMWEDTTIEPWYRQNMFRAVREPRVAGTEPRLKALIHPDFILPISQARLTSLSRQQIAEGKLPAMAYLRDFPRGLISKFSTKIFGCRDKMWPMHSDGGTGR
jgi:hypothetical protein